MSLRSYFEQKRGLGVLSTSDSQGNVNAAIYASPHVLNDETIAFIMTDKLTHKNVSENPHAHYLFKEDGSVSAGKRLVLAKIKESQDPKLIDEVRRKIFNVSMSDSAPKDIFFLVYFKIEKELPLTSGR